MSFLEHLDELRKRLVNSVIIVVLAFVVCFAFSDTIFDFLSVPIRRALSEAERRELPVEGLTGNEKVLPLSNLVESNTGRYVFDRSTKLGPSVIAPGRSAPRSSHRGSRSSAKRLTSLLSWWLPLGAALRSTRSSLLPLLRATMP